MNLQNILNSKVYNVTSCLLNRTLFAIVFISLVSFTQIGNAVEVDTQKEFSWRKCEGIKIGVLLVKHTYAERIIAELVQFERLTGIKVEVDVAPESATGYYAKLNKQLASKSPAYDVIMTQIFDLWNFAPHGHLLPLDKFIADKSITDPVYDWDDIYGAILRAAQWDLVYGHKAGTGSFKQWAIPIGFEQLSLIYRADIFKKHNLSVPKTLPEIHKTALEINKLEPGMQGFVHRGYGFMDIVITLLKNYGGSDVDESLSPAFANTNGLAFHQAYIDLLRGSGQKNLIDYHWYNVVDDLAAGKAAMALDADIIGYMAEKKVNSEVIGKLGYAPPPTKPGSQEMLINIGVWNLSISSYSDNPRAAWLFIQWATNKEQIFNAAANYTYMNPIRKSAWKNDVFINKLKKHGNYRQNFEANVASSGYFYTPNRSSGKFKSAWTKAIRDMIKGENVEKRLKQLVQEVNSEK